MATRIDVRPFLKGKPFAKFDKAGKEIMAALDDWQQKMRAVAAIEPSYQRGLTKWVSEKQRRFVMSQIRKGLITTPHTRTGALSGMWKGTVHRGVIVVSAKVWNAHPRAKFIVGLDQAARSSNMKARGWRTIQAIHGLNKAHAQAVLVEIAKGKPRRTMQIRRP